MRRRDARDETFLAIEKVSLAGCHKWSRPFLLHQPQLAPLLSDELLETIGKLNIEWNERGPFDFSPKALSAFSSYCVGDTDEPSRPAGAQLSLLSVNQSTLAALHRHMQQRGTGSASTQ